MNRPCFGSVIILAPTTLLPRNISITVMTQMSDNPKTRLQITGTVVVVVVVVAIACHSLRPFKDSTWEDGVPPGRRRNCAGAARSKLGKFLEKKSYYSPEKLTMTRWWFQIFLYFHSIWGRFPIWLIFFRWETSNQMTMENPPWMTMYLLLNNGEFPLSC